MSFCPWQESSCNVAFYFCRRSRVQEEDRFLSMPPKQCLLGPQKHWPPPDNACMPRRRKGIVAEYSTWRRRTINKKPTKKTAPLSPMLLEVKNNLPRSKDKKAPSNNWENASRDTSETTLSNNTKIHVLTILK